MSDLLYTTPKDVTGELRKKFDFAFNQLMVRCVERQVQNSCPEGTLYYQRRVDLVNKLKEDFYDIFQAGVVCNTPETAAPLPDPYLTISKTMYSVTNKGDFKWKIPISNITKNFELGYNACLEKGNVSSGFGRGYEKGKRDTLFQIKRNEKIAYNKGFDKGRQYAKKYMKQCKHISYEKGKLYGFDKGFEKGCKQENTMTTFTEEYSKGFITGHDCGYSKGWLDGMRKDNTRVDIPTKAANKVLEYCEAYDEGIIEGISREKLKNLQHSKYKKAVIQPKPIMGTSGSAIYRSSRTETYAWKVLDKVITTQLF